MTSRQAGDVYEMQGPAFEGLSFEDCLPIVRDKMTNRMRWIWGHDLDEQYQSAKRAHGL
jgi:salicylate hydroxylase